MKWLIPSKTFLLGEYAAVAEASAIILTTTPCFELSLTNKEGLEGIHPDSPAGIWWSQHGYKDHGLSWYDPYQACGGLGASSAQFVGSYLATCHLQKTTPKLNAMLEVYYQICWSGKGLRPSGYDVIAQSQYACVFINKQSNTVQSYSWPFKDLSFLLLHTGRKLATHHHLQDSSLPTEIDYLSTIADQAKEAFEQVNSKKLINAINEYHQKLTELSLVAKHSLELINSLKTNPEILAIKGCGALGADILLIITSINDVEALRDKLISNNWSILASQENLYLSVGCDHDLMALN